MRFYIYIYILVVVQTKNVLFLFCKDLNTYNIIKYSKKHGIISLIISIYHTIKTNKQKTLF